MSDYDDVAAAAHAEYANQCAYEELEDAISQLETVWTMCAKDGVVLPYDLRLAILRVLAEANNYRP